MPMGFYSAATLVQDARRHGIRVRPVCVVASAWDTTVEDPRTVRLGLRCVKGLREVPVQAALAARAQQPFASLEDFLRRTSFAAHERRLLASLGALNAFAGHRRAALWQIEAAWGNEDTLFHHAGLGLDDSAETGSSGLAPMSPGERLGVDFAAMELTNGTHPMALWRDRLPDAWCAAELVLGADGDVVEVAGSVICRQRPGTAKGFVFISLEDETGITNCVVQPDLFEARRLTINQEPALRITGRLQHQAGVIHVRAERIEPLRLADLPAQISHDYS